MQVDALLGPLISANYRPIAAGHVAARCSDACRVGQGTVVCPIVLRERVDSLKLRTR